MSDSQKQLMSNLNKAVFPLEQYFTLRPPRRCKWMFTGVVTSDPDCPRVSWTRCCSCGPRSPQPKQSNPPLNKMDIVSPPYSKNQSPKHTELPSSPLWLETIGGKKSNPLLFTWWTKTCRLCFTSVLRLYVAVYFSMPKNMPSCGEYI